MSKAIFLSSTHYDQEIAKYDQQECEVIRQLRPDEADEEVGDMFKVRFIDGTQIDVFADELQFPS